MSSKSSAGKAVLRPSLTNTRSYRLSSTKAMLAKKIGPGISSGKVVDVEGSGKKFLQLSFLAPG